MSENLLNTNPFQRVSIYSTEQVRSGTIPGNGGSASVASITIPVSGTYLIQVTGWHYSDSEGRFDYGHISLLYNGDSVISQQGLSRYTFNILGFRYLPKDSTVNLYYTNWETRAINLSTMAMANFKFSAIRIR